MSVFFVPHTSNLWLSVPPIMDVDFGDLFAAASSGKKPRAVSPGLRGLQGLLTRPRKVYARRSPPGSGRRAFTAQDRAAGKAARAANTAEYYAGLASLRDTELSDRLAQQNYAAQVLRTDGPDKGKGRREAVRALYGGSPLKGAARFSRKTIPQRKFQQVRIAPEIAVQAIAQLSPEQLSSPIMCARAIRLAAAASQRRHWNPELRAKEYYGDARQARGKARTSGPQARTADNMRGLLNARIKRYGPESPKTRAFAAKWGL